MSFVRHELRLITSKANKNTTKTPKSNTKMNPKSLHCFSSIISFLFLCYLHISTAQPSTPGYTCNATASSAAYPCQTYIYYRAQGPDFLDLASVGDLFNVSRLMISKPSNISSPASPLLPNEPLFVPISCGCYPVQNQTLKALSFSNITYTIKPDDTFYFVSSNHFENLTTYQSVEVVNPTLVPTNLTIGSDAYFPIFCKCPNKTQMGNGVKFLVSYVFQASDSLSSVASKFGLTQQDIIGVNGNKVQPLDTIFVPVSKLPQLNQPIVNATNTTVSERKTENKGAVIGLSIGLGICVILLVLVCGLLIFRELSMRKRGEQEDFERRKGEQSKSSKRGYLKGEMEKNLMADVSDTLDKYRVFEVEELRKGTDGFDEKCLIEGSVYKGCIDGQIYAIKKMKWNAREELKILQKVNHGNLVKLEGFCIDPEDASCYLVYEYIENGSLYAWLHEHKSETLNWKTRLRIAVDVANGLQYIHEHTRPRVVHKDIKSSNILLDNTMRAKIANFGLAKSGCNAITRHIVGTHGYIAPEYLADGMVSTKMDVFSFGVVLLELVSGKEAMDEEGRALWMSALAVWEGDKEQRANRVANGWMDKRILLDSCSMEGIINVMAVAVACVDKDPSKRPSMVDIVYTLCKSDDLFFDVSEDGFSSSPLKAR